MYLPNNSYVCQMIVVRNCCCIVHSSLLAWISLVHVHKVLAWLRFTKVYVLKARFSKTFLQITDINFPSNYRLAQPILRRKFPSKYKPSRLLNENFPPHISPSEYKLFQK